ncbi:MAG: hypothetical protein JO199_14725, partial [Candidatus Eremiobacteraeota bacterium]|nr:hypothetical protein [Candidatus Eremiobacteraeota bacterium]
MVSRFMVALAVVALVGCGGGGGATSSLPNAGPASGGLGTLSIQVSVPVATTAGAVRRGAAITPATNGILIQTYAHSDAAHANLTGGGSFDVSGSSTLCTAG